MSVKYRVETNDEYGRYLVANEDIKAGDIIFSDNPIVVGPKAKSELICLNCNKAIVKQFKCCSKCKVAPLCSSSCEEEIGFHSEPECKLLSNFNGQLIVPKLIENLNLITVLRCLLLRNEKENDSWDKFISMTSHCEKRKDTAVWEMHKKSMTLLEELKVIKEVEDMDLIQKICGIIDVNSFELRLDFEKSLNTDLDSICGIYPLATFMAHNCLSNTHLAIDDKFKMIVRASVPILKSTPIYFNYTNVLQGTTKRREHLEGGKYFQCNCIRCRDPTELGMHLSSVKCDECDNGLIITPDPLQSTTEDVWSCTHCQHKYIGREIFMILNKILEISARVDKSDPKSIEDFISLALDTLHPNYYIILEAKHQLAGLLREILNRTIQPTKKMILKKLEICKDFIPILDVLEPGISRLKAITLYEIHIPVVQLANKDHDAKEISTSEFLERLIEAEKYLKEAVRLLIYEPISTPEGRLCRRAIDELRMLQKAKDDALKMVHDELLKKPLNRNRNHKKNKRGV